jgi:hypothetical protein
LIGTEVAYVVEEKLTVWELPVATVHVKNAINAMALRQFDRVAPS